MKKEEEEVAVTEGPYVQRLRWGPDPDAFLELRGFQLRRGRLPLYCLLCCFTLGLSWAVLHVWRPLWRLRLLCSPCPLRLAELVAIHDAYGRFTVRSVTGRRLLVPEAPRRPPREMYLVTFDHEGSTFFWDKHGFQEQKGLDNRQLSCSELVYYEGWTSRERAQLLELHGSNIVVQPKKTGVPLVKAFKSRLARPQYVVLFIGTLLHLLRSRFFCTLHACLAVIVSTIFDLCAEARARRLARAHTERIAVIKVRVLSPDGRPEDLPATALVPGDRFQVTPGPVPCDAVLVSGCCFMSPSPLLAGDAPLRRQALRPSEDVFCTDAAGPYRQNMVLCGCNILHAGNDDSSAPVAVVLRTGSATELSRTLRRRLHPRPMPMAALRRMRALEALVSFGAVIVIGLVVFLWLGRPHRFTWDEVLLRALSTAAVLLPPSLPLAARVLSERARGTVLNVDCPYEAAAIPLWGLATTVCLDAPGSLVPPEEQLFGVVPSLSCESFSPIVRPITALSPEEPLRRAAAVCPNLVPVEGEGKALGSPQEVGAFVGARVDLLGTLFELKLKAPEPGTDVRLRPLLNPFWSTLRLRALCTATAADEAAAHCPLRCLSTPQDDEHVAQTFLRSPSPQEAIQTPQSLPGDSVGAPTPSPAGDAPPAPASAAISPTVHFSNGKRRGRIRATLQFVLSAIGSRLGRCLQYLVRVSDPHDPHPPDLPCTPSAISQSPVRASPELPSPREIRSHSSLVSPDVPSTVTSRPPSPHIHQELGQPDKLTVISRYPADSDRPWSSAVFRQCGSSTLQLVALGDPFAVSTLCHTSPFSLPATVASMREHGLGTAGVAYGTGFSDPDQKPDDGTLHFSGLLLFAPPRPSRITIETIGSVRAAGLRVVLVSSNDLFRSVASAKSAGVVGPGDAVMLVATRPPAGPDHCARIDIRPASGNGLPGTVPRIHYALSVDTLDVLRRDYPDLLETIRADISVYAAAGPSEAARAVRDLGPGTAVIAGGPPLSQAARWAPGATVAVAPAIRNGILEPPSLAAPLVTSNLQAVPDLLRVGRAALETRLSCIRFLLLTGGCRAAAELLLGTELAALTDVQGAYLDAETSLMALALTSPRPPAKPSNAPIVADAYRAATSAFAHGVVCAACQAALLTSLRYIAIDYDPRVRSGSALFALSGYQTVFLAAWALGRLPNRATIGVAYLLNLTTAVAVHSTVLFLPDGIISGLITIPWSDNGPSTRQAVLLWAVVSLLLGAVLEAVVLPGTLLQQWRQDIAGDATRRTSSGQRRVPLFGSRGRRAGFEERVVEERQNSQRDSRNANFNGVPFSGLRAPSGGRPESGPESSPALRRDGGNECVDV